MDERTDARHMAAALSLALRGRGFTSPNPLVGAVVVRDGRMVGSGYHERYGGPHAEVRALEQAGERASGATLYVTLEPCCVWGKTPPCTDAIVKAGIATVVVPIEDPNPEVSGRGVASLRAHGIEVRTGVLRDEAVAQNAGYFKVRGSGLPFVTLKLAMSLDGRLAAPRGGPRWVSSEESRHHVHAMRAVADCVTVGIGTVLADDPMLTDRRSGTPPRQPTRLVFDTGLRMTADSRLARTAREVTTIVACGPEADKRAEASLVGLGVSVWRCARAAGGLNVEDVLRRAAGEGRLSVLCEGGARLASSLLEAGLVDRVALFLSPVLYGGAGRAAFGSLGPAWWARGVFEGARWTEIAGDLLFEAAVSRPVEAARALAGTLRERA